MSQDDGLKNQVSIAILAGGDSRRMGTDKSFVLLDDKPVIQHVIERVQPLHLPVMVIANNLNRYAGLAYPVFPDVFPGCGSLGGIYTALYHSTTPYILCVGCDMPLLNSDLLQYLIDQRQGFDIVTPVVEGRFENLHAVYSQRCLPVIQQQLEQKQLKISLLHDKMTVLKVEESILSKIDPDYHSFINVNTSDDLIHVRNLQRRDPTGGEG